MYHRVHAPVDGRVVAWRYVPGRLFPGNGAGVRSVPGLFTRNERVAVFLDTEDHGPVAVVLVGAANVGRMSLAFADLVTNRGRAAGRTVPATPVALRRGDELGTFDRPPAVPPWRYLAEPLRPWRSRPHGPGPVATRLTVGVVSDTHGLVRPEAKEALRGSDVILHAGDIGGHPRPLGARRAGARDRRARQRGRRLGAPPAGEARSRPRGRVGLILHDRASSGAEPPDGAEGLGIVSSATRTSRWRRCGRVSCGSTPAAPGRGGSSSRCPSGASCSRRVAFATGSCRSTSDPSRRCHGRGTLDVGRARFWITISPRSIQEDGAPLQAARRGGNDGFEAPDRELGLACRDRRPGAPRLDDLGQPGLPRRLPGGRGVDRRDRLGP